MADFDPRKVGETWHSHYWGQNYTILDKNGHWLRVEWEDGSIISHATPLSKGDYKVLPL